MIKIVKNSKSKKGSGFKGIRLDEVVKKYKASVSIYNNKTTCIKYLGYFDTLKEAKKARVEYILKLL